VQEPQRQPSARHEQLLEGAYQYVLDDLSLRPLAAAIGSSPRVLLFLFGSKDNLTRALLARARADELALLEHIRAGATSQPLDVTVRATWRWLSDRPHRRLLALWVQAYARSLTEPTGPWADFASSTVEDWLAILAAAQTPRHRRTKAGSTERTLALAVLRGALLDLLATDDLDRTSAALHHHLHQLQRKPPARAGSTLSPDAATTTAAGGHPRAPKHSTERRG
jgi:AcrR family transcriptional regulator